jgi:uncharacterized YigZ family protein
MLEVFRSVSEGTSSETEIKKSVFFCHIKTTFTVEEADNFIKETKRRYRGYTNASAYIVGSSGEHQRARDNGEPSGTAGIPMLEALKMHDVTNITAVVSRLWGGTELGANGLKRAYGGAVNKAIRELGLVERKLQQEIRLTVDYHVSGQLENELRNTPWITLEDIVYKENVLFICFVDIEDIDEFIEKTTNLTHRRGSHDMGEKRYMPYPLTE